MNRTVLAVGLLAAMGWTGARGVRGEEDRPIWTPPSGPEPRLNAAGRYGARPGRPFLYRIPCTGTRPITFAAQGLPAGITLDPALGILSGTTPREAGTHAVTLQATNAAGRAEQVFRIVVGDTLALTPPMGFNDWYTWYDRITQADMLRATRAMIDTGMVDFGYAYVNIDDCWMVVPGSSDPELGGPARDETGAILANRRFPDMPALTAAIHAEGLKAGIYTSPGPKTCGGFTGSYQHEEADARRFAEWGFDFLKHDWCSYGEVATGEGLERFQKPYRLMGGIVARQPRDIVFNLCQYGMGDVWTWGAAVGGHCWRTTGDLGLEKASRLPGFYSIALANARHGAFAGPGHWNDPDYLLIGVVGNAQDIRQPPRPTSLTAHEQYSYMSLWCLMAAPLFYSGDITRLDAFTLNVLCNAEVIALDQDVLGKQADVARRNEEELVLVKRLDGGDVAVGLFNLGEAPREMRVTWDELRVSGPRQVRDVWRQRELGEAREAFGAPVERHGVVLVRLRPAS